MRRVNGPIRRPGADAGATIRAELFGLGQRQAIQIDQWNGLITRDLPHLFDIRRKRVRRYLALGRKIPAHNRRHQNRRGAHGAGFLDVANHVVVIGGGRIGFAVRSFAGHVVMAELDEDVLRSRSQSFGPRSFGAKAHRTAPVQRKVREFHSRSERRAEAGSPSASIVHRGIADEHNADLASRRTGLRSEQAHRREQGYRKCENG